MESIFSVVKKKVRGGFGFASGEEKVSAEDYEEGKMDMC